MSKWLRYSEVLPLKDVPFVICNDTIIFILMEVWL